MNRKTSLANGIYRIAICFFVCINLIQITACGPKQAPYFQGNFDTAKYGHLPLTQACIQKNDMLSIVVFSDDPTASAIYNLPLIPAGGGTSSSGVAGSYLVSETGDIQFQGLGRLHVEGLTKEALTQLLDEKLKDELKHPYYLIRFLNYKVTVQGEVNKGGTFNIPDERVTILEALALAGDMNVYAKRNDVLVIREENGKRQLARVDITKPDVFNSPYYYLHQNDMVIVEPTKKKPSAGDQQAFRNVSIITAVVSTLAVVYSILRR